MALEALPPLTGIVGAGFTLVFLSGLYGLGRVLTTLTTPRVETYVPRAEPRLSRSMPQAPKPGAERPPVALRALPQDSVTKF